MRTRSKVPAGPDAVVEREANGERVLMRRAGRFTSEDIHHALFGSERPRRRTLADLREAVAQDLKVRHPRR